MAVKHEILPPELAKSRRGQLQHVTDASATLANGASMGIAVSVGDENIRLFYGVYAGGAGRVRLYEDPTIASSTLVVTACAINRAKKSTVGLAASFGHTPGFEVGGASLLSDDAIPGTTRGNRSGGTLNPGMGWILAASTDYVIAACNLSGGAANFSIDIECCACDK